MNNARPVLMPKARKNQLIIKELPDETLVYDQASDKAHCLNETAAIVWKNCDGKNSIAEITASLGTQAERPVDETLVWLALEQLEKFKLLEDVPTVPRVFAGMSRRHLMRNLGVAAVALPMVVSIIAPTPSMAASVCGQTCGSNADCAGIPGCTTCSGPNPKTCK
jgi:coenzyme PQQ synthesis protein D (PqqD)